MERGWGRFGGLFLTLCCEDILFLFLGNLGVGIVGAGKVDE